MRIVYIAKHGPHDNQDEDAISFAMEKLGHTVIRIQEAYAATARRESGDFVLIHKLNELEILKAMRLPIVSWDFDAVVCDDPNLVQRDALRKQWAEKLEEYTQLNFFTDGDWVNRKPDANRIQLMQGADERYVGYSKSDKLLAPIIFTGTTGHGFKRDQHINELIGHYRERFLVTGDLVRDRGCTQPWRLKAHGRALADRLASAHVVISPDGPSTNNYWSNRVYLTLGLGGFLIHPFCERLQQHYSPSELVTYKTRPELIEKIDHFLEHPEEREEIRARGHQVTLERHLYRHRVEQLIETVKERLL